jgi:hypothetical protein
MFSAPPMTRNLSGLKVEYALALIYSVKQVSAKQPSGSMPARDSGLGFQGELPVLFHCSSAVPVRLAFGITMARPTTGRFTFFDQGRAGHVSRRRSNAWFPISFFQKQIYRHDGDTSSAAGQFTIVLRPWPEYRWLKRAVTIPAKGDARIEVSWSAGFIRRLMAITVATTTSSRRLRALHLADGRRPPKDHVPAGDGRRAERRKHSHVGSGLQPSAPILFSEVDRLSQPSA